MGAFLTNSSKVSARLKNLFKSTTTTQNGLWTYLDGEKHLFGSIVGVASVLVLGFAMLPLRSHISVSTAALVLVIPVVVGSAIGGIKAGIASVIAGFIVYDYGYIPPYKTLDVGTPQNWTALGVYVIVMLLVASVVASLDSSRYEARRGARLRTTSRNCRTLGRDRPVDDLLETIVSAVHAVFGIPGVSLLILDEGVLKVVASAGEPLSEDELARLSPHSGQPISVGTDTESSGELRTIALSVSVTPSASSRYGVFRRRRMIERCSPRSPMTQPWRWSARNCENRRFDRNCWKRSTDFAKV